MNKILLELENRRSEAKKGGGKERILSQHKKGKLTARERIEILVDPGSFEEFDMFVTHRCTDFDLNTKSYPGDGVITGWATVNNQLIYLFSQDLQFLVVLYLKLMPKKFEKLWIWLCKMVRLSLD